MKVLLINVVCGVGSTGRICTDIAENLEKDGHQVVVAYGRGKVPKKYKRFAKKIGNVFSVVFHAFMARLFDASGFFSKRSTKKFIKWIDKYDPDVIHMHNIHGYYINIPVFFEYLKKCNKKIFWTMHDCWAVTGHSVYCDAISCNKWKEGCNKCPQKSFYPKAYIDKSRRNWLKKKDIFSNIPNLTVITPSFWLKNILKASYMSAYNIVVIHNGVDLSTFKEMDVESKRNDFINKTILLSVSSIWNTMKGLEDIIALAKNIGDDYIIFLVGRMKRKCAKLLPNNIRHINHLENKNELVFYYNLADYFINLTHQDTYPTVNLEAIACSLPIISYDVGGSTEIINEYGGKIVEKYNINEFADNVRKKPKIDVFKNETIDYNYSIKKYISLYEIE